MRRLYSRLAALDSLRGFGILLVVLGHTSWSAGLVSWIFSFHMPLFFIISGMLFHERQFLDSFKRKAIRLLVPYVFFGTVTLAYWALIERRLRGDEGSVPNALANIVLARAGSNNYPQNAALWFLPCLFVTEMLFLGFFLLVNKTGSVETKTVMGGAGVIGLPSWRWPWSVSFRSSSCGPLTCRSISSDFRGLLISCPSPCCSTASVTC